MLIIKVFLHLYFVYCKALTNSMEFSSYFHCIIQKQNAQDIFFGSSFCRFANDLWIISFNSKGLPS